MRWLSICWRISASFLEHLPKKSILPLPCPNPNDDDTIIRLCPDRPDLVCQRLIPVSRLTCRLDSSVPVGTDFRPSLSPPPPSLSPLASKVQIPRESPRLFLILVLVPW